jgi:hypothetical protein
MTNTFGQPTLRLGPQHWHSTSTSFLRGWNTLPDEMKLHILKYTVPSDYTYYASHFQRDGGYRSYKALSALEKIVYPLLSIDEIKGLVLEAFYSQNTMAIKYGVPDDRVEYQRLLKSPLARRFGLLAVKRVGSHVGRVTMYLPPLPINNFVRHLKIYIACCDVQALDFLARLAEGKLGFKRLRSVHIVLQGGLPPQSVSRSPGVPKDASRQVATEFDHLQHPINNC